MRLMVLGMGYSGRAIARHLAGNATWTGGTTRSADRADVLRAEGIEPFLFDGATGGEGLSAAIRRATHLVVSIAPGEDGDPVLARLGEDIGRAPALQWIGYLSTVGVYGNHDGGWVDESTPCRPTSRRSVLRVAAEQAWIGFGAKLGVPTGVFRLAGIYGPGRNAFVNFEKGTARRIDKPGQVFNRVHVDDIGRTVAAAARQRAGGIYNVSDDEPAPPQDVVAFAAELLGIEPPPLIPFDEAELSPMGRSFYGENKRVRNDRIKRELGVSLAYPTYREALRALRPKPAPTNPKEPQA